MKANDREHGALGITVLSQDQIRQIVSASFEILERIGVDVFSAEAVDLLADAGAHVTGRRVRIPSYIVEGAVRTAPSRVVLSSRSGTRKLFLEDRNVYFGLGADCPFVYDRRGGEKRKVTERDLAELATIADCLDNIDFVMPLGLVSDAPIHSYDVHELVTMIRNTDKPVVFGAVNPGSLLDACEICGIVAGSYEAFMANPFAAVYAEPAPPLKHVPEGLSQLLLAAEKRFPIVYTPGISAGGTGPVTIAGSIAQAVAECLSGLTIHQLKKPGSPFVFGGVVTIMDMSRGTYVLGAPELHLASAAMAQIARFLGLPMYSTAGCSDAKVLDQQAAIESAVSIVVASLSGANLIHDVGFLDTAMIASAEMMVLSDEVIGMAKRIIRGIEVSSETLAIDVLERVGPGGNFVGDEHTYQHFRTEDWFPSVLSREGYQVWAEKGSLTMGDKIRKRISEILSEHRPLALPPEVDRAIDAVLKRADAEVQGSS